MTPDFWRFDMMGIRKRALFIVITGLVSAGLISFGCSSSNSTTTGSGGSAGTSASGGSAGTGTSASGGSAGTGTAGASSQDAGSACTGKTDAAPTGGVIDEFTAVGDAGATPSGIPGGYTTYSDPAGAPPTVTFVNGTAHVVENATATASPRYVGFVIYFNDCINASTFTGIEFTISGTMTGCTMQLSANYSGNDNKASDPAKGSCSMPPAADCYANQKAVTGITTTPTTVQVPWSGFTGGVPAGPTDSSQLTGVQWQLTIAAGTGTCAADISITDVKFY